MFGAKRTVAASNDRSLLVTTTARHDGGNQAVILPRLSGLARQSGAIPTCWGRGSDEDSTTGAGMQWNLLLQPVAVATPGTDVNSDTSSLTGIVPGLTNLH